MIARELPGAPSESRDDDREGSRDATFGTYHHPSLTTPETPVTITTARDEVRSALDAGTAAVGDALRAAPYNRRHIPGALNLVIDAVDQQAAHLLPDRAATIVTYSTDAACGCGEALAARLEQIGYLDVRVYRDGIEDWVRAGLRVEAEHSG